MGLLSTEVHGMSMDRVSIFPYLHLSHSIVKRTCPCFEETAANFHLRGKSKSLKALSFNLTPCRMIGLVANTDTSTFSSCAQNWCLSRLKFSDHGTNLCVQVVPELGPEDAGKGVAQHPHSPLTPLQCELLNFETSNIGRSQNMVGNDLILQTTQPEKQLVRSQLQEK